MRTFFIALCFAMTAIVPAIAQNPIEYRINSSYGFSDPNGNKDIVVEFPGKSAHEIYTMMAVNIGVLYYEPDEVFYGVSDAFISVGGHSSDFCRAGDQKWSAKYILKFVIRDEKVLVLNPSIRNLTEVKSSLSASKKLEFLTFVNTYWYNQQTGQFVTSEADNRSACASEISSVTNQILGLSPIGIIPENW